MLQIVAVRDRAVNGYARPVFVVSVGQAIRSFADEVNRKADDNEMSKHPEDYDLYHLGSFDDEMGLVRPLEMPLQLAVGKNLVR